MSRFFDATLATEEDDEPEDEADDDHLDDEETDAEENEWDSSVDDAQRIEHYTDDE